MKAFREAKREALLLLFIFGLIVSAIAVPPLVTIWWFGEIATTEDPSEVEEEPGLEFKQLKDNLYSITGTVKEGDCERISRQMPEQFVVILESPGGSLDEGICLAAHIKNRKVITVVRNTAVYDEEGNVLYTPGLVQEEPDPDKPRTVCASACGLLFLGGDERYLIGNVWFGIHGPRTPEEYLGQMGPRALEQNAYRTAGRLLQVLKKLGVRDEAVRMSFIMIPGTSMYWLNPRDFRSAPGLGDLATHYVDFWGVTGSNPKASL
jgi:hypothetical protein